MLHQLLEPEVQTQLNEEEFFRQSGFPKKIFNELLEIGAFEDFQTGSSFSTQGVVLIKKANRLRKAFDLDATSIALLLHYIEEVDRLEKKVQALNYSRYL